MSWLTLIVVPLAQAEPQFTPYGTSHIAVLVVFAVGVVALVVLGRRLGARPAAQRRVSRVFALVLLAFLAPLQIYLALPSQFGIGHSLPLQMCDLAALAVLWSLWSHHAWSAALSYFWGLTLTAQAFITPEVNGADFPHLEFVTFWGLHLMVVWGAVYLTWGVGLRPSWRGYRIAVAATVGWAAVMFPFNAVADTNYGFLNEKPLAESILDYLGDWPVYLFWELVLVLAVWALITWPWTRSAHGASSPQVVTRSGG